MILLSLLWSQGFPWTWEWFEDPKAVWVEGECEKECKKPILTPRSRKWVTCVG